MRKRPWLRVERPRTPPRVQDPITSSHYLARLFFKASNGGAGINCGHFGISREFDSFSLNTHATFHLPLLLSLVFFATSHPGSQLTCAAQAAAKMMAAEAWTPVLLPPTAPCFWQQDTHPVFWRRGGGGDAWTAEENKLFEKALALIDRNAPDRWEKVAEMLPRKTVDDVMNHYHDLENDVGYIEAGLVPFPHYSSSVVPSSGFTLEDWDGGFRRGYCLKRARGSEQERKKGVPWTEEEHK